MSTLCYDICARSAALLFIFGEASRITLTTVLFMSCFLVFLKPWWWMVEADDQLLLGLVRVTQAMIKRLQRTHTTYTVVVSSG